uniref:Uncharacterized protein ORFU12 n=1 Tax=Janthinobacterium sp. (strain J3) TaxID=213804 RepID=Q84II8_JANS3|nr:hypothetical protein [Janthinobacterium sp. J3]
MILQVEFLLDNIALNAIFPCDIGLLSFEQAASVCYFRKIALQNCSNTSFYNFRYYQNFLIKFLKDWNYRMTVVSNAHGLVKNKLGK